MKIGRFSFGKMAHVPDEYDDPPRPFMEHLLELRDCVVHCAIAWFCCALIMIPFLRPLIRWLKAPAGEYQNTLQILDITGGIMLGFKIILWGGTALSLPFLFFFIMRFVFPGLKRSERSLIVFCLATSTVLFSGGVWMAYAETLSIAIDILQKVNAYILGSTNNTVRFEGYVEFVFQTIIAFGLAFQLPLLLLLMGWIGIISSQMLRAKRRLAIVLIFTIAMVLTPPDPISQIVMAIPMCLLYELCIGVIWLREKARRTKKEHPAE